MATFSDLVTFTRSGTATYVDSTGTYQTAADGDPRIGHHVYENGVWVNKGLLVESEAATDLFTQSGDMDAGAWSSFRADLSDGDDAPYGSEKYLLGEANATNANGSAVANQSIALSAKKYTWTVHAKAGPSDPGFLALRPTLGSNFNDAVVVWFDLSTGTVSSTTSASGSSVVTSPVADIKEVGAGEYLCILTFTVTSADTIDCRHYVSDGDAGLSVTTGKQVQVWGAKIEEGEVPSEYIPTTTAAVTRSGESATVPAAKLPDLSGGATFILEGALDYADTGLFSEGVLLNLFLDANNAIRLKLDTQGTNTGNFIWQLKESGSFYTVSTPDDLLSPDLDVPFKIAVTMSNSEIGMTVDGTSYTSVSVPGLPDFSGVDMKIGDLFQGTFSLVRVFDTVLSEADRESETS